MNLNKILNGINIISNIGLSICILFLVGVFAWAGFSGGNFIVGLVFTIFPLIFAIWLLGLMWIPKTSDDVNVTGDDVMACISGDKIADEVTRGIHR